MVNWAELDASIGIPNYKKLRDETDKIITKASEKNDTKLEKSHTFKLDQALRLYEKRNEGNSSLSSNLSEAVSFDLIVELRKRFIKASISKYW